MAASRMISSSQSTNAPRARMIAPRKTPNRGMPEVWSSACLYASPTACSRLVDWSVPRPLTTARAMSSVMAASGRARTQVEMGGASPALAPRSRGVRSARAIPELPERGDGGEELPGRLRVRGGERWGWADGARERVDLPGAALPDEFDGLGAP